MAAGDQALRLIITADASQAGTVVAVLARQMMGFGNQAALAGSIATAAIVTFFVSATRAAGDFQRQFDQIFALAIPNTPANMIAEIRQQLLQTAIDFGQTPDKLTRAFYDIASSVKNASDEMSALHESAMIAETGMADVDVVAKAITTTMNLFHLSATQAANAMTVAVTQGSMHWQDYANTIGQTSEVGKLANHTFDEINAALDVLTTHGFRNATEAGTNLRQLFTQMDIGMDALAKRAHKMGLSFDESKFASMDLAGQIAYLNDITGGASGKLETLIGGGQKAIKAFESLRDNLKLYGNILGEIKDAQKGAGAAQEAWLAVQQDFNVQLDQLNSSFQVFMITVGTLFLPIAGAILGVVRTIVQYFTGWIASAKSLSDAFSPLNSHAQVILPILTGIGTVLVELVIPAVWAFTSALLSNPLVLVATLVAGLTAAFVHFYQTSKPFRDFVQGAWHDLQNLYQLIQTQVIATFQQWWGYLQTNVIPVVQQLWQYLSSNLVPIMQTVATVLQAALIPAFGALAAYLIASSIPALIATARNFLWIAQVLVGTLIPILMDQLTAALGDAVAWFQLLGDAIVARDMVAIGDLVGMVWAGIVPAFTATGAAVWGFTVALLANPITWFVLALIGLGLAVWYAYNSSKPFRDAINNLLVLLVGAFWSALQRIGAFLQDTFAPVWQDLVNMWNNDLLPALQQLWQALQPLMPLFAAIGEVIGFVLIVVLGLLTGIIAGLIKGLAGLLSGIITIIGGIAHVFTGIVQIISGFLQLINDLFHARWGAVLNDLKLIWAGIVNIIQGALQIAWGIISGIGKAIWGFLSGFVQGIVGFFQWLYDKLVGRSIIPDMIMGIWNWFMKLPGLIGGAIWGLIQWIANFFVQMWNNAEKGATKLVTGIASIIGTLWGLAQKGWNTFWTNTMNLFQSFVKGAEQMGANIINGILNGIKNAWNGIVKFVQQGLTWLRNLFPHSPVKDGPLVGSEHWGDNFVENILGGIKKGVPLLHAATSQLTAAIGAPFGAQFQAQGNAFALQGGAGNQGSLNMVINLDSKPITQAVGVRLAKEIRIQGNVRGR